MLSYGFTKIPSHVDCWASRQCLFQYSGWGKPQCATVHVCNAFPTLCMFPMPVSPWPPHSWRQKCWETKLISTGLCGCCRNTLQRSPGNFPVLMDDVFGADMIRGKYKCPSNNVHFELVCYYHKFQNYEIAIVNCTWTLCSIMLQNL